MRLVETLKETTPRLKERVFERVNGKIKIVYDKRITNPEHPEEHLYFLKAIHFEDKNGKSHDLLRLLKFPRGWSIAISNAVQNPTAHPEKKTVLLPTLVPVLKEDKSVKTQKELNDIQQKIKQGRYGRSAKGYFNEKTRRVRVFGAIDFFSADGSLFALAHEFRHARKRYSKETIERKAELRKKPFTEFTEADITDYGKLVVLDEYERNRETITDILQLRNEGINLEPSFADTRSLEEYAWSSIHIYEQKLYPELQELKSLTDRFSTLIEQEITLRKKDVGSARIFRHLEKYGLHKPRFEFYFGMRAKQWLQKNKLISKNQTPPDVILIFNFPKPVAQFWFKRPNREDDDEKTEREKSRWKHIIPWGMLYQKYLPIVWRLSELVDYFYPYDPFLAFVDDKTQKEIKALEQGFRKFNGFGLRVNEAGEHDPKQFYYVWGWWLRGMPPEEFRVL